MQKQKKLSFSAAVLIGSTLFGLFFGAGNLIFPVRLGQLAGGSLPISTLGLLITATGLPFLAIVGMGLARADNVQSLANHVHPVFSFIFTLLLYLTIGPMFALPRTASTAFEVGVRPLVSPAAQRTALVIFTVLFFAIALFFALRPGKIMVWVGKILNPLFLLFLTVLFIKSFLQPMAPISTLPIKEYATRPFLAGFLEGYNTMDVLAALAFGSIVITLIKKEGVIQPEHIAGNTVRSGVVSVVLMGIIYSILAWLGATSVPLYHVAENGGQALALISRHYFGTLGSLFLAATITVACLKTAIGLVTACSQAFNDMMPAPWGYRGYCILMSIIGCVVANVGLTQLISLSTPVLMLLYPLAITLVLVSLLSPLFRNSDIVYKWAMVGALLAGIGDMLNALPQAAKDFVPIATTLNIYRHLPFFKLGFGWVVPAFIGLLIGSSVFAIQKSRKKSISIAS